MKNMSLLNQAALLIFGIFIWTRDAAWTSEASDTLPMLVAFPIFVWLTWPWKTKAVPGKTRPWSVVIGFGLSLAGIAVDSTLLLAAAWILFFDFYRKTFLDNFPRRFLLLPLFGFPWLMQDFLALGRFFLHST
jgi:hypothetical protein